MAQKYEVLTEALTEHAGNVDRISDQMGQAAPRDSR